MKKRKFSLLLNIVVLTLCVCAIAIGVYSAKTASLSISGSIGFEAHNCKVKVSGKLEGAYIKETEGSETLTSTIKYFNTTSAEGGEALLVQTGGENNTWSIGNIYFDDINCTSNQTATPIVFTFTFENLSTYFVSALIEFSTDLKNEINISGPTFATTGYIDGDNRFALQKSNDGESGTKVELSITLTPKTDAGFDAIDLSGMKISFNKTIVESVTVGDSDSMYTFYNSSQFMFEIWWDSTNNNPTQVFFESVNDKTITDIVIPEFITDGTNFYCINATFASALQECSNLTSVTIPNSIKSFGDGTFAGCTNLTSITYLGTKAQWNTITKGSFWNSATGEYTIHCTDGDIAKES